MDDFVVWGETAAELRAGWRQVEAFLTAELGLALNPNVMLNRTGGGMDFVGVRVYPHGLRLTRQAKRRFVRKFRAYEQEQRDGRWTELQLQQRVGALVAFTLPCRSRGFRRNVLKRFGAEANGHQPCDPRRQLEQLSGELPVGTAQQQQPGQRQQQPRLPGSLGPSSTQRSEDPQADPATVPSSKTVNSRQRTPTKGPVSVAESGSANPPGLSFQPANPSKSTP